MINRIEIKYFLRFLLLKDNIFSYLKIIFLKFMNRYLKHSNYEYYPEEFRKIHKTYMKIILASKNQDKNERTIKPIFLASEHCLISPSIDWRKIFYDYEDYEALHRFRWLRYKMSTQDRLSEEDIIFSNDMLSSWYNHHMVNCSINHDDLAWCSHTITERMSNILLFRRAYKSKNNDFIDDLLTEHAKLLLSKLEIHELGYGNHLINNARSVFLYPNQGRNVFLVLRYSLDDFIYEGYSIDYSSHYQLLLLFWLNDIYRISEIYNKTIYCNYLSKFITGLKKSTLNFYLPETKKFIFVGDISPDYPPSYLLPLIDIYYDNEADYSQEYFYDKL